MPPGPPQRPSLNDPGRPAQGARTGSQAADKPKPLRVWTVERKARVLTDASTLDGEALTAYLEREWVKFAQYEQCRLALDEPGAAWTSTTKRIRQLERELARKEKALAEAAALLVFKRKWTPYVGRTRTTTRTGGTRYDPRSCRPGTGAARDRIA